MLEVALTLAGGYLGITFLIALVGTFIMDGMTKAMNNGSGMRFLEFWQCVFMCWFLLMVGGFKKK